MAMTQPDQSLREKATAIALKELQTFPPDATETTRKRNVLQAIGCVASNLGNTPAICRKCYIHPSVLEQYMAGTLKKSVSPRFDRLAEERQGPRAKQL